MLNRLICQNSNDCCRDCDRLYILFSFFCLSSFEESECIMMMTLNLVTPIMVLRESKISYVCDEVIP